jgi:hypothetical protein
MHMDSVSSPESAVQAEPAEHAEPEEASSAAAPDPNTKPDVKETDPESSTPGTSDE